MLKQLLIKALRAVSHQNKISTEFTIYSNNLVQRGSEALQCQNNSGVFSKSPKFVFVQCLTNLLNFIAERVRALCFRQQVSICLECNSSKLRGLKRKWIRCSAQATVLHLKKFIAKKLNLTSFNEVQMTASGRRTPLTLF